MADAGNQPTTDTTRRAYDLLAEGFGPGFNGPLLVVADQQGGTSTKADVARLHDALTQVPGVAFVSPAIPNPAGDTAVIQVFPTSAPQDEATTKLIHHLRSDVVPAATKGTDMTVYVGGFTAASQDFADVLSSRLPLFIGAVLGLSFLLLLVVFRSIVVPLKAVIMNLLSIARCVRRDRRGVPVGMAERRVRRRQARADRGVGADDAVRDRVRPLDGLRGVPPLPHQGGVRPHR